MNSFDQPGEPASAFTSHSISSINHLWLVSLALLIGLEGPLTAQTERSPFARFHHVDLTNFVRKALSEYARPRSWASVPRGLQTFDGVPFLLHGKVELTSLTDARDNHFYPTRFTDIAVGQKGHRLHILHGTLFDAPQGSPITKVVLNYANNQQHAVVLKYGVHARDWYARVDRNSSVTDRRSKVAWTGHSGEAERRGATLRLYKTSIDNPLPQEQIKSIDLFSLFATAGSVIVAITLEEQTSATTIAASLTPPGSDLPHRDQLTFVVMDVANGKPVTNASALLEVADGRRSFSFGEHSADAQGRIIVDYSPQVFRSINAIVSGPDHRPAQLTLTPTFPREMAVKLERGARIGGLVRSTAAKPLSNATIRISGVLSDQTENFEPRDLATVKTDGQGRWATAAVPTNFTDLLFKLSHPDHYSAEFNVVNDTGLVFGNNLTREQLRAGKAVMEMEPAISVEGTVIGSDGKPLAEALVALVRRTTTISTLTEADGRFRLTLTNETDHSLLIEAEGHAPHYQELLLQRDMEPLQVKMNKGRTLRGRVMDDTDKAVQGASIRVVSWQNRPTLTWTATTDADGRFKWRSAPEDAVQLSIAKDGFKTMRTQDIVAREEEIVLKLTSGFLVTGRVIDVETKEPIPQFTVFKGNVYSPGDATHWERYQPQNGKDGAYSFKADDRGPRWVRLLVEAPGYLPAASPELRTEGWHKQDFELKQGEGPKGTVVATSGDPISGAEVTILGTSYLSLGKGGKFTQYNQSEGRVVQTDGQGRFNLPAALPNWVVAVHEKGFAKVHSDDLAKNLKITLEPWGWIEGTLHFGAKPAVDEEVMLAPTDTGPGGLQYSFEGFRMRTDTQGSFIISNAPPGEGRLVLLVKMDSNSWMWSHTTPLTVKAGKATKFKMGGKGRPVIGQAKLSNPARQVTWGYGHSSLSTKWPQPPRGPRTDEEMRAWQTSPEYKTGRANYRSYAARFQPDGSFRIEDVPAGTYDLRLDIREPRANQPGSGTYIGSVNKEVVVPAAPNGVSDEPFDLGEVVVPVRN